MTPPRLWRWLLHAAAPRADRRFVDADLGDEFDERVARDGTAAARAWYARQARRSIGPLLRARVTRASQALVNLPGVLSMRDLRSDLLFFWRRATRRPLVPLIVVLTMAVGIGAVTAVFSVAEVVLLRPLPLPDSGRIVRFFVTIRNGGTYPSVNYHDFLDTERTSQTLSAAAAFEAQATTWRTDGGPEPLPLVRVGPSYAKVLGVTPAIGRMFDAAEFLPGGPPVAILTDRFWRRAFGGDAVAIGRSINLDGIQTRIVGVLPAAEFLFPAAAEIWVPLVIAPDSYLNNRNSTGLSALARVRGDRSVDEARSEIATIGKRLAQQYPYLSGRRVPEIRILAETLAAPVRATLLLLSGIVVAVLLIAATNITDLLLSDAASRGREFAIRAAIGGATARLARQIVVESLALAAVGGIGGALLAPWMIQALIELYPTPLPRLAEVGVHARAYGVGLGATLIAGLLVSVPLIRAAGRHQLASVLRDGDRGSSRRGRRLTSTLVVVEVALSVALLAAGVALARAFATSASSDVGFSPAGTLTFNIAPSDSKYPDSAAIAGFYSRLLPALRQLPGVTAVGTTQFLPFTPGQWGDNFVRVGTSDRAPDLPSTTIQMISPGLPEALGLRVVSGRAFTAADSLAAPRVAMVNETLARQQFENAPLGRDVIFQKITWRIVGVLNDKRHTGVLDPPQPELYVPWEQFGRYTGWVVMRTNAAPLSALPAAKEVLRAIDPTVAMTRPGTMDERVAAVIAPERFRATLTGTLGATALILAALGLYGVMAHAVSRRTHEIGLRLALGETPARVRRRVVRGAIALSAAGIGVGLLIAYWTAPYLETFLKDGATARDAGTLLLVSAVLFAVSVLAAWIPARRAARLDPAQVLRSLG